jgi:exopolysaccharide biosynthesis polyprenyl glycosylphosphotransferase
MSEIPADTIERSATRARRVLDLNDPPLTVIRPGMSSRRRIRRERIALVSGMGVTDALSLLLGLGLATLLTPPFAEGSLLAAYVLAPLVSVTVFGAFRLYATQHLAPAEEFRRVILASTVSVLLLLALSSWSAPPLAGLGILVAWSGTLVLTLAGRKFWRWLVARARIGGRLVARTLVIGTNGEVERLAHAMRDPEWGYRLVGCVETGAGVMSAIGLSEGNGNGASANGHAEHDYPVLGHLGDLDQIIRETESECLFVATTAVSAEEMTHISRVARRQSVQVCVSSNMSNTLPSRVSPHPVGNVMALALKPVRLSGTQAALKRMFDLLLAFLGVAITSPVWIGTALAIKLTSRGPVFFRQERVGRGGRSFRLFKFRTMVQGAESMLGDLRTQNEASGPLFKMREDPRITGVGRWLRRWSVDELPQLLNVLRGEMSLVGPRPALPAEVGTYEEWHNTRLEVAPGITGLWQVSGRSDVSFDEYVRLDLFYIENWSLAYDLFILAKTLPVVATGRGSY